LNSITSTFATPWGVLLLFAWYPSVILAYWSLGYHPLCNLLRNVPVFCTCNTTSCCCTLYSYFQLRVIVVVLSLRKLLFGFWDKFRY
jgi:hypothetical protein